MYMANFTLLPLANIWGGKTSRGAEMNKNSLSAAFQIPAEDLTRHAHAHTDPQKSFKKKACLQNLSAIRKLQKIIRNICQNHKFYENIENEQILL